jgi:hypothetical protein
MNATKRSVGSRSEDCAAARHPRAQAFASLRDLARGTRVVLLIRECSTYRKESVT